MGCIYCYTNSVNQKQYVGQTIDLKYRLAKHKSNSKRGMKGIFYDALRKHDEKNFIISVLEENIDNALLDDRERYWIKELNSKVPLGYNLTNGGEGGDTSHSEAYKNGIKNRPSVKGKNNPMYGKRGIENPNFGRTQEDSTKKKISSGNKNSWSLDLDRKLQLSEKMKTENPCNLQSVRDKISITLTGRKQSIEQIQKRVETMRLNKERKQNGS